jgi:signal transduction histidine kinase
MRWPIRLQLLVPTLSVVVLAIALASLASSYWAGTWARQQQQANLQRVVHTLSSANYPLTQTVLETMSGLSGAEFVVLDQAGTIHADTLDASEEDVQRLIRQLSAQRPADHTLRRSVGLGEASYVAAQTPLLRPRGAMQPESVVILFPEERWWTQARQLIVPPLIAGAVAVVFVIGVTWWLSRRLTRPIGRLCAQAETIAGGHFEALVPSPRNDELRDLGLAINRMAGQLARYEQEVRQSERLQTLAKLGGGMAHQLRNAITGARMATELHQRDCPHGRDDEPLHVALRQLSLMETYVQRFLMHGRLEDAKHAAVTREDVDLAALIADAALLVRPAARHANVELSFAAPAEPCHISGDAQGLRQMLINLLMNAIEAATRTDGQAGSVDVQLRSASGQAEITVRDSGPGPAEHVRGRLFEPFVSEKRSGVGLGLSVARQISQEHGGTIGWERRADYTCFIITLPAKVEVKTHAAPAGG